MEEEAAGVVVTIDAKGGIYINDVWTRLENFEQSLDSELRNKGTSSVYLRGDSTITYGTAIGLIGRMREMGIDVISLVTAHHEKQVRR